MKKLGVFLLFFLLAVNVFAQRKFALVIGNAAYSGSARLRNPVNDANDMAAALLELGFNVDKVTDGSLDDMERAITRLKNRLSMSNNAYGFFFYAGHGVQSNGMNYLIPVGANITSENYLRERAVSVQTMLAELNEAGNALNVVVLDACRDNPFEWARGRGGSRGLTVVSNQPADSIIVYATSEGSIAADGEGRNGLFTTHLLKNLKTPGLEVSEIFRLTGADVSQASGRRQIPAVYNKFFGRAYLGSNPVETAMARPAPTPQPAPLPPATPIQPVQPDKERDGAADKAARLSTLGVSVGSTFSVPWFVGTVNVTLAPFMYTFFDLGVDFGLASGYADVNYYSFYPFAHYAFFVPYKDAGGWYAGAGAGYMMATYQSSEGGSFMENTFAADLTTGVIIKNVFTISYTLRTDFKTASNKVAVGFVKRMRN